MLTLCDVSVAAVCDSLRSANNLSPPTSSQFPLYIYNYSLIRYTTHDNTQL